MVEVTVSEQDRGEVFEAHVSLRQFAFHASRFPKQATIDQGGAVIGIDQEIAAHEGTADWSQAGEGSPESLACVGHAKSLPSFRVHCERLPVEEVGEAGLGMRMDTRIIDGKAIAAAVLKEVKADIAKLREKGTQPGLAVVLVGDDPASKAYVGSKERKCKELGMHSRKEELSADTSQEDLLKLIQELNEDERIHGILVQSPPPPQIDEAAVVRAIRPEKDVDGFHPVNVAKLALEDPSAFVPCTPLGCQRLLVESGVPTEGAHVVILGRSLIVGKSLGLLLMAKAPNANATVTIAHSRTKDLADVTRQADILIAAIGRPKFVTADHVKEGAVVIDVGINRVDDPSAQRGYRLVGDVDYEAVAPKCEAITPVPGGVGPMTIAMLMANTIKACRQLEE